MKNYVLAVAFLLCLFGWFSIGAVYGQTNSGKIYETVDKVPVFKKNGGKVQKYLSKNIKYPVEALALEQEGKVLVSFIVTAQGKLKDAKVEKSINESLDNEALRVVNTLSDWKPAKVGGKDVATRVTLPVHFYLSEENKNLAKQLKPFYESNKPPLFVLDNKKVLGLTTIEYYNVKSIRVIKGEKAIARYGEEAKNGVLVIQTKKGTPRDYQFY